MNPVYEKLVNCYNSVREKIDFVPDVAIVLGSGLGDYGKEIKGRTPEETSSERRTGRNVPGRSRNDGRKNR